MFIRNCPRIPFRVLVVDDDLTHLSRVENILLSFGYQVEIHQSPEAVLLALQRKTYISDIVVCGVPMSNPYAHFLVRFAGFELDIPVVLMSLNYSNEFVSEGILNGATRCFPKPIQPEDLKNIWQFAVSQRRNQFTFLAAQIQAPASFNSAEPSSGIVRRPAAAIAAAAHGGGPSCSNPKPNLKRRQESTTDPKKPCLIWTDEHNKIFLDAIEAHDFGRVVPTKILEYMRNHGLPNITRENVVSRLQKYHWCARELEKSEVTEENDIGEMEHPQPPQIEPLGQDKVDLSGTNNQPLPPLSLSDKISDVDNNKDSSKEIVYYDFFKDHEMKDL